MIASALIVTPAAIAWSRASVTARPALLVPSPEISMILLSASAGAAEKRSIAKSIAALIEVRPRNERGAASLVAHHRPVDDDVLVGRPRPFDKGHRDPVVPAADNRAQHARIGDRRGIPLALQVEFSLVDAA